MKHPWTRTEAWAKGSAGMIGGFASFLGFTLAIPLLCLRFGLSMQAGLAWVTVAGFPLWMALMVWALLARSGGWAWIRVGALSVLLWLLVLGGVAWPD